jgi:hypothetical protein
LLQRLQLFTEATEFYRYAKDPEIRKLNTVRPLSLSSSAVV